MNYEDPKGLHRDNPVWTTLHLNIVGQTPGMHKALRIPGSPFVALAGYRPNTWVVVNADTGQIVRYTRGTKNDARIALIESERSYLQKLELDRQYEAERPAREAEEARREKERLWYAHGSGLYITPFCKVEDETEEDEEGCSYGPFRDDEDGAGTRAEAEKTYWEVLHKDPNAPHVALIEAESRADAVKGIGHVWITDGLEKGPPVDPRQAALPFDTGLRRVPREDNVQARTARAPAKARPAKKLPKHRTTSELDRIIAKYK